MSVSSTLPLNVAETGPIFILTTAVKPLSPIFSNDWQPGIADLSTSGSFSSAQTLGLSAGKVTSPVIVIAMNASLQNILRRSPACSRSAMMYQQHFATREKYQDTPPCSHSYNDDTKFPSNDLVHYPIYSLGYYGERRNIPELFGRQDDTGKRAGVGLPRACMPASLRNLGERSHRCAASAVESEQRQDGRTSMARFLRSGEKEEGGLSHG